MKACSRSISSCCNSIGSRLALQPLFALHQVAAVVGLEVGDRPVCDLADLLHDHVEEVAIVGHDDHGVRVVGEELLEPGARLDVEMVGRLVEQQQLRPAQQQRGERQTHLPTAGELAAVAVEVGLAKAEARQHPLGALSMS